MFNWLLTLWKFQSIRFYAIVLCWLPLGTTYFLFAVVWYAASLFVCDCSIYLFMILFYVLFTSLSNVFALIKLQLFFISDASLSLPLPSIVDAFE